jgi:hypothetical protein
MYGALMFEKKISKETSAAQILEKGFFDQTPGRFFFLLIALITLTVMIDMTDLVPPAVFWQSLIVSMIFVHGVRAILVFGTGSRIKVFQGINVVLHSATAGTLLVALAALVSGMVDITYKAYQFFGIIAGLAVGVEAWLKAPSMYVHSIAGSPADSHLSMRPITGEVEVDGNTVITEEEYEGDAEPTFELDEMSLDVAIHHEAGHAITLALLPDYIRSNAFINIGNSDNTMTCSPSFDRSFAPNAFSRWRLVMLLAGPYITNRIYDCSMSGSYADHEEWRALAKTVLTSEMADGWSPEPDNPYEAAANEAILKAMKVEQIAALKDFFDANQEIYNRVVEYLKEHLYMDAETMDTFFSGVDVPFSITKAMRLDDEAAE